MVKIKNDYKGFYFFVLIVLLFGLCLLIEYIDGKMVVMILFV